jgi:hypothetical protein
MAYVRRTHAHHAGLAWDTIPSTEGVLLGVSLSGAELQKRSDDTSNPPASCARTGSVWSRTAGSGLRDIRPDLSHIRDLAIADCDEGGHLEVDQIASNVSGDMTASSGSTARADQIVDDHTIERVCCTDR